MTSNTLTALKPQESNINAPKVVQRALHQRMMRKQKANLRPIKVFANERSKEKLKKERSENTPVLLPNTRETDTRIRRIACNHKQPCTCILNELCTNNSKHYRQEEHRQAKSLMDPK